MHRSTILVTLVPLFMFALGVSGDTRAATFRFDLTEQVDEVGNMFLEFPVDLGTSFKHIESASFELVGNFTPGTFTPALPPSEPVVLDNFFFSVYLGEPGNLSSGAAYQLMKGVTGHFDVEVPVSQPRIFTTGADNLPGIVAYGATPVDFSFLLDGQFQMQVGSIGSGSPVQIEPGTFEASSFEFTSFVLKLEVTAIPEPGTIIFVALAVLTGIGSRRLSKS